MSDTTYRVAVMLNRVLVTPDGSPLVLTPQQLELLHRVIGDAQLNPVGGTPGTAR